eukprot:6178427-Pleurochrysis_carterae.AAC.1
MYRLKPARLNCLDSPYILISRTPCRRRLTASEREWTEWDKAYSSSFSLASTSRRLICVPRSASSRALRPTDVRALLPPCDATVQASCAAHHHLSDRPRLQH